MFDSARHHEQFTRPQWNISVSELDSNLPLRHQEHFVGVGVGVPDEFTFDLDDLDLVIIEGRNLLGRPVLGELTELLAERYRCCRTVHVVPPSGAPPPR